MKESYYFKLTDKIKYCLNTKKVHDNIDVTFDCHKLTEGTEMSTDELSKNYIIGFLSGVHEICACKMGEKTLKGGDMICVPKNSKISGKTIASGEIVTIAFDTPLSFCDQSILHDYLSSNPRGELIVNPVSMLHPMRHFFNSIAYLIKQQKACAHLHKLKFDEFFIILRGFYKKEDVISFLGPSILGMSDFAAYLSSNYQKARNLQELIRNSHYSRSVFYRKFKEHFLEITPQKWFYTQKKSQFIHVGSIPDMSPKTMMTTLNFNSMSTMVRLCKELFDCTPALLIKKLNNHDEL